MARTVRGAASFGERVFWLPRWSLPAPWRRSHWLSWWQTIDRRSGNWREGFHVVKGIPRLHEHDVALLRPSRSNLAFLFVVVRHAPLRVRSAWHHANELTLASLDATWSIRPSTNSSLAKASRTALSRPLFLRAACLSLILVAVSTYASLPLLPEPSVLSVLALGLVSLAVLIRRRRC